MITPTRFEIHVQREYDETPDPPEPRDPGPHPIGLVLGLIVTGLVIVAAIGGAVAIYNFFT